MPAETLPREDMPGHARPGVWFAIAFCILAVSLAVRASWYPVVISDYTYFTKMWFDNLATHPGLTSFGYPFANYAPLYLYALKALTAIPVSSLVSAKTLSFAADALIAYFGYRILKRDSPWSRRNGILFLAAVILLSLPTVMMNSSLWGQSDALYAAPVVASLFFLIADAPLLAALAFGVGASVKLQAVFFAPVLIGYLLKRRKTWKYLLVPPVVFFLSVVPAWMGGGSLYYWLFIYATQAREYPYLSVSGQSAFAFLEPLSLSSSSTTLFFWIGIAAALCAAAAIALAVWRLRSWSPRVLVLFALIAVLLIPYLLPRMHERYFYLADLFAVLYAFYRPDRFIVPVIVVFASLISYMPFLSPQVPWLVFAQVDLRIPAALLLLPLAIVLSDAWRAFRSGSFPALALYTRSHRAK